jgi:hypothetical protein
MKTFFSGITALFSILALLISGFTAYKVFTLDQELDAFRSASAQAPPASAPTTSATPASGYSPAPPASSSTATAIQPGQMIQPALRNGAKVELLFVRRIKDPATGTPDVVNVQFRVRRIAPKNVSLEGITSYKVKAINPETNEVYKVVSGSSASADSGYLGINLIERGASVDAHTWLSVPEGVSTVDIYVPETQTFKNVPIS